MSDNFFGERDTAQEEQKEAEAAAIQRIELDGIMATETGRRVIYKWIVETGYFEVTFNQDSHVHAYISGLRAFGCNMIRQLEEACHDKYLLMLRENADG